MAGCRASRRQTHGANIDCVAWRSVVWWSSFYVGSQRRRRRRRDAVAHSVIQRQTVFQRTSGHQLRHLDRVSNSAGTRPRSTGRAGGQASTSSAVPGTRLLLWRRRRAVASFRLASRRHCQRAKSITFLPSSSRPVPSCPAADSAKRF